LQGPWPYLQPELHPRLLIGGRHEKAGACAGFFMAMSPLRVGGATLPLWSGWAAFRLAAKFADKSAPTRRATTNGDLAFFMGDILNVGCAVRTRVLCGPCRCARRTLRTSVLVR